VSIRPAIDVATAAWFLGLLLLEFVLQPVIQLLLKIGVG
jgi:hypothetical protein